MDRKKLLFENKKPKRKSISAWTTTWDPRTPPKGWIIHDYKSILYSDPVCIKVPSSHPTEELRIWESF